MTTRTVLITGAGGEIGHGLIEKLSRDASTAIVALDLNADRIPHAPNLTEYSGDILDQPLIASIFQKHRIDEVFHLAAILSSGGERDPVRTHQVNVDGSLGLLSAATESSRTRGSSVRFIFPSTIAVYGIPSLEKKRSLAKLCEDECVDPITMYGTNKLYVERLGTYFSDNYRLLDADRSGARVDFRAVRFPGLLSKDTLPTGGTSDYGSEMIHAAAQGKAYECFVSADSTLPFMAMPDAVDCLLALAAAPCTALTRRVYNVTAFSVSAEQIRAELLSSFPHAEIGYHPTKGRQDIVNTWPADLDDTAARRDWGWKPRYDFRSAMAEYLIPGITKRYS